MPKGIHPEKVHRAKVAAIAYAEQQRLIWFEYKRGKSIDQVAQKLNLRTKDVSQALRDYLAELRREGLQSVAEYRHVQLERINAAIDAVWPRVLGGNVDAINTMIRLLEREARLLGLDAPTKVDITTKILALAEIEGISADEALEIADAQYKELSSGVQEG